MALVWGRAPIQKSYPSVDFHKVFLEVMVRNDCRNDQPLGFTIITGGYSGWSSTKPLVRVPVRTILRPDCDLEPVRENPAPGWPV